MKDPVAEVIRRHLKVSATHSKLLSDAFCEQVLEEDPYLFDRKRDLENLERLSRALGEVIATLRPEAMTQAARFDLEAATIDRKHVQFLEANVAYWDINQTAHGLSGDVALACLRDTAALAEMAAIVRHEMRHTVSHIKKSEHGRPSLARLNLRGVRLVEIARSFWRSHKGTDAPQGNDLNVLGPFGAFLSDLFEASEIESDPRSAYRAWARQQEVK